MSTDGSQEALNDICRNLELIIEFTGTMGRDQFETETPISHGKLWPVCGID
jgi:uncharacterized protein with HEPN domain